MKARILIELATLSFCLNLSASSAFAQDSKALVGGSGRLTPAGSSSQLYRPMPTVDEDFSLPLGRSWVPSIPWETVDPTPNFSAQKGSLKIWPQRNPEGQFFNRHLSTNQRFYQTYGFFEIEAKLPKGNGTWPAFWLVNDDHVNDPKVSTHPYRPEIDIFEAYASAGGSFTTHRDHPATIESTIWKGPAGEVAGNKKLRLRTKQGGQVDLSAGFHKYGLKWEPRRLTFYFDGEPFYTAHVSMPERKFVVLSLQLSSKPELGVADETTPQGESNSFEIHYLRVWQFKNLQHQSASAAESPSSTS